MLCPSKFQPHLSPFMMDFHWPVRSLWPETRPLFFQIEQEMMRHMQEMRQNLEFMERLHQRIFDQIDHVPPMTSFKPISFKLGKEGDRYALTLDTTDFSPEDLSVKQVGRKLRVSGKTEKKQDDGKGSYSYRCQEFRQEFDLPGGVSADAVTCSLQNGQLQIQAPKETSVVSDERVIPITRAPAVKSTSQTPVLQSPACQSPVPPQSPAPPQSPVPQPESHTE
ncbi:heat shock protein beta-11 [Triplophysa rosa]|uniref:heat shock protein beta-11 n=1 Tax=Triplophysa rosa TaxID=992332 RepID=UPI002545E9F3|nr:heat shock protein beta-11 [Triplophysa rosa]